MGHYFLDIQYITLPGDNQDKIRNTQQIAKTAFVYSSSASFGLMTTQLQIKFRKIPYILLREKK